MVARMLRLIDDQLVGEQISFFLAPGLLVTFQENEGDVWQPIRERIATDQSLVRGNDASWLAYALLDALVDHCFPILETYGDVLEALETEAIAHPSPALLHRIHRVQHELAALRRVMWPTRELVQHLQNRELALVSESTRTYLRDVYEHTVQIIDIIETFREMTASLADLYLSSVSNRMNEIMKVLTVIATLFIPATFLAGVYGMNFEHFPELQWRWAYPAFWAVTLTMMGTLLVYFWRRKWI
jgi:magnesium transporter